MDYADAVQTWSNPEEVKRSIVEETLLEAFNPYSSLEEKSAAREKRSVVTYTVQQGDTLSEIAHRYGVSLKQIVAENRIANPHLVGIGLKLVLRRTEVAHPVQYGETLEAIAERYEVSREAIINANPLLRLFQNQLYVGQVLYVPVPDREPAMEGTYAVRRQMAQAASRASASIRLLDWPVRQATITSGFGMRWGRMHKGVDLWHEAKANTPILAAKEGRVIEAGAQRGGYGFLVVLDHGNGLHTYYAHLRKILVNAGQYVQRGQILGYMGQTGDTTGYHLHFEVRQDDVPINPLRYLRR